MSVGTRLSDYSDESEEWDGDFELVECRRALSPTNIPGLKYTLNPYGGCAHGCVYCYAPGYTHSGLSTWRIVRVRTNIVDRLARELPGTDGTIGIGSSTDPYQYAESRFLLTRQCLEVLASHGREAAIVTKSDLVIRDIPLLASMECSVGITITGLDERISKMAEPGAPLPSARLDAMRRLVDAGIDTYAMIAPVMSSLEGREGDLVDAIAAAGVRHYLMGSLNARQGDEARLGRMGLAPSRKAEMELKKHLSERGFRLIQGRSEQVLDALRFQEALDPDLLEDAALLLAAHGYAVPVGRRELRYGEIIRRGGYIRPVEDPEGLRWQAHALPQGLHIALLGSPHPAEQGLPRAGVHAAHEVVVLVRGGDLPGDVHVAAHRLDVHAHRVLGAREGDVASGMGGVELQAVRAGLPVGSYGDRPVPVLDEAHVQPGRDAQEAVLGELVEVRPLSPPGRQAGVRPGVQVRVLEGGAVGEEAAHRSMSSMS